jgi:hypothetical protein
VKGNLPGPWALIRPTSFTRRAARLPPRPRARSPCRVGRGTAPHHVGRGNGKRSLLTDARVPLVSLPATRPSVRGGFTVGPTYRIYPLRIPRFRSDFMARVGRHVPPEKFHCRRPQSDLVAGYKSRARSRDPLGLVPRPR